jgi:uncharacterized membrane protein YgaE (UPF0421/DUF939 family)
MKVSAAVIAHAQVWTFCLALGGFLALLFVLVIMQPNLTPTIEKIVASMLTVLGTLLASMSAYFFSRQRPDSTKPPETP